MREYVELRMRVLRVTGLWSMDLVEVGIVGFVD